MENRTALIVDIELTRADGRLARLLASWARIDVLVIDDFVLRPLGPDQAADVLKVIEDRVQVRSTIVTSQLPVAMWHAALVSRPSRTGLWTGSWRTWTASSCAASLCAAPQSDAGGHAPDSPDPLEAGIATMTDFSPDATEQVTVRE